MVGYLTITARWVNVADDDDTWKYLAIFRRMSQGLVNNFLRSLGRSEYLSLGQSRKPWILTTKKMFFAGTCQPRFLTTTKLYAFDRNQIFQAT